MRHIVDAHRTAEHDEAVVTPNVERDALETGKIDVANPEAGIPELSIQRSQHLVGDVLKDEELAHSKSLADAEIPVRLQFVRNSVSLWALQPA